MYNTHLTTLKPGTNSRDTDNIGHKTQNKDNQNKNTTQKTKTMSNRDPKIKPGVNSDTRKGNQLMLLIRHPPCYSYIYI